MTELFLERTVGRYVIQLLVNRNLVGRQQWHVRISDLNREVLLSSEKYSKRSHAEKMVERFVRDLDPDGNTPAGT